MRTVCWNGGSAASTGILEMNETVSGLRLFQKGPAKRSSAVAIRRKPKTADDAMPIGFHRASARRQEVMPRNAMKIPQPSIECGNDHAVSSRPNAVCQTASKKPAKAVITNPPPARAIGPGMGKGNGASRSPSPNHRRRSDWNVMYASVIVAQKCIDEAE